MLLPRSISTPDKPWSGLFLILLIRNDVLLAYSLLVLVDIQFGLLHCSHGAINKLLEGTISTPGLLLILLIRNDVILVYWLLVLVVALKSPAPQSH